MSYQKLWLRHLYTMESNKYNKKKIKKKEILGCLTKNYGCLAHLYTMKSTKWVQGWLDKSAWCKKSETFSFYQFLRSIPSFVKPLGCQVGPPTLREE